MFKSDLETIGDVLQIITSQDWETFGSDVLSNPEFFRNLANAVSSCSQLCGMTLLHGAVRCNPPQHVVTKMIQICPDMLAAKDCLGRTPLHVAAGSKASASLLRLLANACPAACNVQDEDGKTPLHFLCDTSCVLFEEDHHDKCDVRSNPPPNHEAVLTLLSFSIHAATIDDDEEMSPLEHAIMSNSSLETVKLLQFATSRGMQLSRLQSFIAATTSLQPQEVDDFISSITYNDRPVKRTRRVTAYQEDSNSIV
ncbi:hypothetical protein ACHAXM_000191 [Skeletonema potamos]